MTRNSALAWAGRAAILLAVVGVFGTWRTAGLVSLDGFQGPHNGWLVIVFGLIALLGIGPAGRGSWPGIVLVFGCGAVMAYTCVKSLVDERAVIGGSPGWGLWLSVVASAGLGVVAVMAAAQRVRPSPF